jgi:DNA-binding transcriptional LysR family regulator
LASLLSVVDLRALQAFVMVCETRSMTETGRLLGISQSAVSQLIKSLEQAQGGALFDRDFRPLRPNAAGRVLFERAGDLLEHAQAVAQSVRAATKSGASKIRLGCVDSFAATIGPQIVLTLASDVSELTLWAGLTPAVSEQLLNRELDLAVCTEAMVDTRRVTQRPLFAESFVAVVPKPRTASATTVELRDALQKLPLLRYTARSVIGQQVERFIRHIKLDAPRRYEFDTTDSLLALVAAGFGCAITTPLCLWQSRHYLDQIAVANLPSSRLGQRYFFLLTRNDEWSTLADAVAEQAVHVAHRVIEPALRERLPSIPPDLIN